MGKSWRGGGGPELPQREDRIMSCVPTELVRNVELDLFHLHHVEFTVVRRSVCAFLLAPVGHPSSCGAPLSVEADLL